jgi:hypothetical protein
MANRVIGSENQQWNNNTSLSSAADIPMPSGNTVPDMGGTAVRNGSGSSSNNKKTVLVIVIVVIVLIAVGVGSYYLFFKGSDDDDVEVDDEVEVDDDITASVPTTKSPSTTPTTPLPPSIKKKKTPVVKGKGKKTPVVKGKGKKTPVVKGKGKKTPVVKGKGKKTPVVKGKGKKTPVVKGKRKKTPVVKGKRTKTKVSKRGAPSKRTSKLQRKKTVVKGKKGAPSKRTSKPQASVPMGQALPQSATSGSCNEPLVFYNNECKTCVAALGPGHIKNPGTNTCRLTRTGNGSQKRPQPPPAGPAVPVSGDSCRAQKMVFNNNKCVTCESLDSTTTYAGNNRCKPKNQAPPPPPPPPPTGPAVKIPDTVPMGQSVPPTTRAPKGGSDPCPNGSTNGYQPGNTFSDTCWPWKSYECKNASGGVIGYWDDRGKKEFGMAGNPGATCVEKSPPKKSPPKKSPPTKSPQPPPQTTWSADQICKNQGKIWSDAAKYCVPPPPPKSQPATTTSSPIQNLGEDVLNKIVNFGSSHPPVSQLMGLQVKPI